MIRASIHGRLGADPVERQTKNGKLMVTASLAVSAGRPDADEQTVWFSMVAFGRAAEVLPRHVKGDLLAAMGPLYHTRFIGRDGIERGGWSLTIEAILSTRTVRPGGGRKPAASGPASSDDEHRGPDQGAPFDDPIPPGM